MREGKLGPLGGGGMVVEADETYVGKATDRSLSPLRRGRPLLRKPGTSNKRAILGLIDAAVRFASFHVIQATKVDMAELLTDNSARESTLDVDESKLYGGMGDHFADRQSVKHSAKEFQHLQARLALCVNDEARARSNA